MQKSHSLEKGTAVNTVGHNLVFGRRLQPTLHHDLVNCPNGKSTNKSSVVMDPAIAGLGGLRRQFHLRVPNYQRNYSWGGDEVKEYLDDREKPPPWPHSGHLAPVGGRCFFMADSQRVQ